MPARWGLALQLSESGLTYVQVGDRMSVSKERAGQLIRMAARRRRQLVSKGLA